MEQQPLVRPVGGGRPHEAILAQVEDLLTSGRLRPGDRLPSERDLAEQLGVSRPTVREAMRTLDALGVTTPASTLGRGAASVVVARPGEAMGAVLRLAVATSDLPVDDVVDLRVLLEREAVGRLAVDPGPDLAEARELLDLMDAPGLPPAEFHRLDAGLHVALARAAGNRAVEVVMTSLRAAIEQYVLRSVPELSDWEAVTVRLRAEHRSVVEAVAAGDPAAAAQRVEDHIRGFHSLTGAAPGPTGGSVTTA